MTSRPTKRRARQQAGFTMIELLITMLLLMIVILGLTALQITTIRQVTSAQRGNEASQLAHTQIELIKTLPLGTVNAYPKDQWQMVMRRDLSSQMVNVGGDGESPGPYSVQRLVQQDAATQHLVITIRVSWVDSMRVEPTSQVDPGRMLSVWMTVRRAI
jgi:Tfp pilus assembly protein FimT